MAQIAEHPRHASWLLGAGIALIVLFFIPDILSTTPVFPIQTVAVAEGLALAALLTPALLGAAFVTIAIVPIDQRKRKLTAALLATAGVAATTLPENNHLPHY